MITVSSNKSLAMSIGCNLHCTVYGCAYPSLVTTSTATKSNSITDSHSSQVTTKPPRKLV